MGYVNFDQSHISRTCRRRALIRCLLVVVALGGSALDPAVAAGFDPSVRGPAIKTSTELGKDIAKRFQQFRREGLTQSQLVQHAAEHAKLVDLRWRVNRAIDAGQNLDDLWIVGITGRGDGSYEFDLEIFPYWHPYEHKLQSSLSPDMRSYTFDALSQRGFRESDIRALAAYIELNNPYKAIGHGTEPVTSEFAARTKRRATAGKRLDENEQAAYDYQMFRQAAEAHRVWASGLLDVLDNQRKRILESYLTQETSGSLTAFPSGKDADVARLEEYFLADRYEEVRRSRARAADQLWRSRSEAQK